MANEITYQLQVTYVNGSLKDSVPSDTIKVNQAAQEKWENAPAQSTSEADIVPTGVTTLGWLYLRNLDGTNSITYGPKSAGVMVALGRLNPLESAWLRLEPGITLRAKANAGTPRLQVKFFGN